MQDVKRQNKVAITQRLDAGVYTYYVDIAKYSIQQLHALKLAVIEELEIRDATLDPRRDDVPLQLPPTAPDKT